MKPLIRITTVVFVTATLMLSCSTLEKREGGGPVMQGAKEVTVKRDGSRVWIDGPVTRGCKQPPYDWRTS